jgi:low temperature requirement protein LtrA
MASNGTGSIARGPEEYEVTPVELFFDLVYVFAISQLSQFLLQHLSWMGFAQAVVLYLAVFWAWAFTTWATSLTDPTRAPVRTMLLVAMLFGLFMNAAIPEAFGEAGWLFVATYLATQIGRTVWLLTARLQSVFYIHFQRALIWQLATSPLWIAGAAMANGARILPWSLATAVDLAGSLAGHPLPGRRLQTENLVFAVPYLFERGRLFFLIALGETVLTTGAAITVAQLRPMTLLTGTVALAGTVAIWWAYFRRSERVTRRSAVENVDPARTSGYATYSLMLMVAGLIAISVGDELVLAHSTSHTNLATNIMLYGGPALFFFSQGWYMRAVTGNLPRSRPIGVVALVIVGAATLPTPSFVAAIGATSILVGIAIADALRAEVEETPVNRTADS